MRYKDQFDSKYNNKTNNEIRRKIVIASVGRSGSHYLGHVMTQAGMLGVPFEYFHNDNMKYWMKEMECSKAQYLERITKLRSTPNGVFSTKIHYHQLKKFNGGKPLYDNSESLYIYLRRKNVIKQAISTCIAEQTGAWISTDNKERHVENIHVQPDYNPIRISNLINSIYIDYANWDYFFLKNKIKPIQIYFEDLIKDTDKYLSILAKEVGEEYKSNAKSTTKKQSQSINDDWYNRYVEYDAPDSLDELLFSRFSFVNLLKRTFL